jgi:hypothetical protein
MKQYDGKRTIDGIVVTVDGARLDERFDIRTFDEKGFEWSYEGSAPRQLALAILADHFGDAERALSEVEPFMKSVIANLDNDWTLDGKDIDDALA